MKKSKLLIFVVIGLVILGVAGYFIRKAVSRRIGESAVEKLIEAQTGGKVDVDTNADGSDVTIKTEDGSFQYSAGGDVKIPDGFPKELIVASDAKLTFATSSNDGASISYLTNASLDSIFNEYKSKLAGLGWKKEMELTTDENRMLNFSKSTEAAAITIGDNTSSDNPQKTTVSVIYTKDTE